MHSFKSDGRYKFHDKGLGYIVQFRWSEYTDRMRFAKMIDTLRELYGPDKEKQMSAQGYTYWKWNENWRCEQNREAKRRRIYLKDESVLSYILLQID